MSKQTELPSYEDATSNGDISTIRSRVQAQVHNQLSTLGQQIAHAQERRLQDLYKQDQQVLNLILPIINSFLETYGKSGHTKAKLVIVPASKINQDAAPADDDLLGVDEFSRVERIPGESEGRWFWEDRDVARRIASYLQPIVDTTSERKQARISAQEGHASVSPKDTKRPFWKKTVSGDDASVSASFSPRERPIDEKLSQAPLVLMDVQAEEVAFRIQNSFGVYETESGWGIVVRIVVNLT